MMRFRPFSVMRNYLLPSVAAIFILVGTSACSSSGDSQPNPAIDGAASGENSATSADAASGAENGAAEGAEATNAATADGTAAGNPIGNELNNAIANDKGAASTPENEGAINSAADSAAAALPESGDAAVAPASAQPSEVTADANAGNPFGSAATTTTPAPMNASNASSAPIDPGAASAVAPASESGAQSSPSEMSSAPVGPTALPEAGSKMAYYVVRGDTLAEIAQKIYGSRNKWKSLRSENGLTDANKIYPGDVIYFTLNESSKAFAEKYELSNRQVYKVAKGDTLSQLAAKFYGTQGAWRTLWKENPQISNPDRILVGMVISFRAASKVALKDKDEKADESESDATVTGSVVQTDAGSASQGAVATE